ncbi:MAG: DinB family protein [Bacteroidetes bacterium]|nr:DinB family protein [Bacteroidota bacterium]MBS1540104.1 DinB family protein [Bacteroidota bacterium]
MKKIPFIALILIAAACDNRKGEIESTFKKYDQLTFKMKGDSLADLYVKTGTLSGKGMKQYVGQDSIRKFLNSFNPANIHLISNATHLSTINFKGDTAHVDGTYEQKAKLAQGDTGVYTGTFTSKWINENGHWHIASMYTVPTLPAASLKSVLLKQLKSTHTEKGWFVPANVALEGVTAKQAMWKDNSGNHSIGQLTYHLLFWNKRLLKNFKGETAEAFSGNNEETFDSFDEKAWNETVQQLNAVMTEWEQEIKKADDNKLNGWYENIANMSTHNAYHTGQIVFVRKLQKSWDAAKGVK